MASGADSPSPPGDTGEVRIPRSRPATLLLSLLVAVVMAALIPVVIARNASTPGDVSATEKLPAATDGPATVSVAETAAVRALPRIRHVFVVNIENKGFTRTWGPDSAAPYLSRTLRSKGLLLRNYYGTAHNSQGNYVAQISGQGPNSDMQADCQTFSEFRQVATVAPGQAVGNGCVFPRNVDSLPMQLSRHQLSWKGYMEDMVGPCQHPEVGARDQTQSATPKNMYATRHNPFAYFHAIIDRPDFCRTHVRGLPTLTRNLRHAATTPNLSYLTPDLCNDGHDAPCADGRPGGLKSIDVWMKKWIPRILSSPAYRTDGMLIITADESDGPQSDASACCGEVASPNSPAPGITGPGGGRIGALVISAHTKPGTSSGTAYNHYALLGSIEELFKLAKLGYAGADGLRTFGADVYNRG